MLNMLNKKYIFVLVVCILIIAIIFVVCKNDEVFRVAIGNGIDNYMVLYENGDYIVEYGWTVVNADITKKPYIAKKYENDYGEMVDSSLYSRAETKLSAEEVDKIKNMVKCLDNITNETDHVLNAVRVNIYYNGREIWHSDLDNSPQSLQQLIEELIKLSPMEIKLFRGE